MIEIYTKKNCSYCVHAKEYMTKNLMEYVEYKLGIDFERETILEKFPTAKTYPIIVIDNEYIGGFVDLKNKMDGEQNVKS